MTRHHAGPSVAALSLLLLGTGGAGTAQTALVQVQRTTAPRFVYASGYQGVGYYSAAPVAPVAAAPATTLRAAPAPRVTAAPAPAPAATVRPRSVGPGARNWSTGNRVGLHRPWLRARD